MASRPFSKQSGSTCQRSGRSQRGVSSVLFMLLSGFSLGAMVFGGIYYVRSLQVQSVTVHALTQAQLKAWSGTEAVRQYLFQLGATDAAKLSANQTVSFAGVSGISATVTDVLAADSVNCGGGTRVGFNITGSSGGANALLAATFCAKGSPGGGGTGARGAAVSIKGNLDISGDLNVLGDAKTKIVVDGKVTGAGSLNGISNLYASGDISLGGATSIATLFSEGNIALSGSGSYSSVQAMGNVALTGGVSAGSLKSNGTVSLLDNSVTDLSAIGNVSLGNGALIATLKTRGNVTAVNSEISGSAQVQGNYSESSAGKVSAGNYGGSLNVPAWNSDVKLSRVAGLNVAITALTAGTISLPSFDAYAYQSSANYAFERVGSDTKVTIKNVSSIPDGVYFLVGSGSNQDYVCSGKSYSVASCPAKICNGNSPENSCFSYSAGKWTLAGTTMAPGIVWFKGDFMAGSGTYYNSWVATGNVETGGDNVSYAANYAGYSQLCTNSSFPNLAPKNFCKAGSSTLLTVGAGNIAFGAGGLVGSSYSGGKIKLSASIHVYGDVLAGDILETGGSTTVHGYISAARTGSNAGNSIIGASTKIDLSNLPSTFKPGENAVTPAAANSANLLWSRYR